MKLTLTSVSKSYAKGKKKALDDFTSELTPGIYGLLGPNGAGKSTLMSIMTDNLKPDQGEVCFNGTRITRMGADYRRILGYVPQQQGLYDEFTGERFLWYMAALKGLSSKTAGEQIERLLSVVHLTNESKTKIGSYSGGMKQRILIAQALLNDPEVLIMDEPTVGLDPKERIKIRNFISTIARNKIVVIATHLVADIEFIAKELLLLRQGKLLLQDQPSNIMQSLKQQVFEIYVKESELTAVQQCYQISNIASHDHRLCVRVIGEQPPVNWNYNSVNPNLEDVYLHIFGEDA